MSKFAVLALTHGARRIAETRRSRDRDLSIVCVRTDMTAGTDKIAPQEMIDPADLAASVIALPNTATVPELLVTCRIEAMV